MMIVIGGSKGKNSPADEKPPSAAFPLLSSLRRSCRYASLLDLQAPCIRAFLISLTVVFFSHVQSPNKAGSAGAFGIKLSEYAKSKANEDEFFIAPDVPTAERGMLAIA